MTVHMEVEKPQDVRVTLACTMTVAQWQELTRLLRDEPSGSDALFFADCINDGINRIKSKVLGDPRLR